MPFWPFADVITTFYLVVSHGVSIAVLWHQPIFKNGNDIMLADFCPDL